MGSGRWLLMLVYLVKMEDENVAFFDSAWQMLRAMEEIVILRY